MTQGYIFGTRGNRWSPCRGSNVFESAGALRTEFFELSVRGQCYQCPREQGQLAERPINLQHISIHNVHNVNIAKEHLLCPFGLHRSSSRPVGVTRVAVRFKQEGTFKLSIEAACMSCYETSSSETIPELIAAPTDSCEGCYEYFSCSCCPLPLIQLSNLTVSFAPTKKTTCTSGFMTSAAGIRPFSTYLSQFERTDCRELIANAASIVRPLGFQCGGIQKGSAAASAMSAEARMFGGCVPKMQHGGITAALQSIGSTGLVNAVAQNVIQNALNSSKHSLRGRSPISVMSFEEI